MHRRVHAGCTPRGDGKSCSERPQHRKRLVKSKGVRRDIVGRGQIAFRATSIVDLI